jgi:hypothetical protein
MWTTSTVGERRLGAENEKYIILKNAITISSKCSALPGDLPGGVPQDVLAIEREDAGTGLQLALGA